MPRARQPRRKSSKRSPAKRSSPQSSSKTPSPMKRAPQTAATTPKRARKPPRESELTILNDDSMVVNVSQPMDSTLNDSTTLVTQLLVNLSPTQHYGGDSLDQLRQKLVDTRFMPTPTRHVPQPFGRVSLTLDTGSAGEILAVGDNGTGQLGLGSEIVQRKKPQLIVGLGKDIVQACAGGMHSLALDSKGSVYSWGCNDDFALGRPTEHESSEYNPAKVALPFPAVQISAGDSHSAALLTDGTVFAWGTFRDTNGPIGLQRERVRERKPIHLDLGEHVVKIASGGDHLALLSVSSRVYTLGGAEQGQLGRVGKQMSVDGGRTKGLLRLLSPDFIRSQYYKRLKGTYKFSDVWCGNYSTFVKTKADAKILASGLNNYFQLANPDDSNHYTLVPSQFDLEPEDEIIKIAPGLHHSIALSSKGKVFAFGRPEYGRLGLGPDSGVVREPTQIKGDLDNPEDPVVDIGTGASVSFAVTKSGRVFSWGMGVNFQTGHGDQDVELPTKIESKQIDSRKVLSVSAGGQHTLFIARQTEENHVVNGGKSS